MSPTIVIDPFKRPAIEHAQLHRRQVLGLVHDDVAVGADRVGVLEPGPGPQQLEGLVEQRDVVVGEHDLGGVVEPLPGEQLPLVGLERLPGRGSQQARRSEQVVQQLTRRQDRPHALERLADQGIPAGALADDLDGVLVARRRRQPLEQQLFDELAARRCGSGTGDGPG